MQEVVHCKRENDNRFTFMDVCYKEGSKIPIIEESARLKIAERLVKQYNTKITIRDVESIISEVKKEYGNLFTYEIEP